MDHPLQVRWESLLTSTIIFRTRKGRMRLYGNNIRCRDGWKPQGRIQPAYFPIGLEEISLYFAWVNKWCRDSSTSKLMMEIRVDRTHILRTFRHGWDLKKLAIQDWRLCYYLFVPETLFC
jgi:hypothetical protein